MRCNSDPNHRAGKRNKLNVRMRCDNYIWTTWSVVTDVDVNWEVDNPGYEIMEDDVDCRVYE